MSIKQPERMSSDGYKERQRLLNDQFTHRVEAWLSHFKVDYA